MQHWTKLTPSPLETPVTTYVGIVNELWWSSEELGHGVDFLACYILACNQFMIINFRGLVIWVHVDYTIILTPELVCQTCQPFSFTSNLHDM